MSNDDNPGSSSSSSVEESSNCLFWNSHASDVADTLVSLQQSESMVDVTLKAGGEVLKVHKMVLSASSPFLQVVIYLLFNLLKNFNYS